MNVECSTLRAENLRRFRQRHGLKQVEMAAKIGMLQTVLCDFENGARHVSLKAIDQIAGAFGMPSWQLLQDLDSADGQPIMTADERVVSIVAYLHAVAAQQDKYARRSEGGVWHPSDKPGPHAGFVYTKLLTQRAFMARALAKRIARGDDLIVLPKAKETTDA